MIEMSQKWDLSDPKQKLCYELSNKLMEESGAIDQYRKLAETLRESDNPGIRALALLFDKLAQDEESHHTALTGVARLVCPLK